MNTQTLKQDALETLQRLPENADIEEIMYRLYVLENIRRGQKDTSQSNSTDAEQLLKDIQASIDDPRPSIPYEEMMARMDAKILAMNESLKF
jgi:hypothetical protein